MTLIVCIDNKNGVLFNHRRQSQDRILRSRILAQTAGARLWMRPYSAKQFDPADPIRPAEDFLSQAGPEDYCFLEGPFPQDLADRVTQVILYRWNRDYPADVYFDLDLSPFQLCRTEDFAGSSHETITEEVYTLCEI